MPTGIQRLIRARQRYLVMTVTGSAVRCAVKVM
jgi:hypothetical protein